MTYEEAYNGIVTAIHDWVHARNEERKTPVVVADTASQRMLRQCDRYDAELLAAVRVYVQEVNRGIDQRNALRAKAKDQTNESDC